MLGYFQRFPQLRVLFFFDEQQEYLEEVKALHIPDVDVVFYENNPFTIKCQLVDRPATDKVLLYLPMPRPNDQDAYHHFPLMGLLMANKEVQLDDVGGFMEEFGLQRHQKSLVSKYIQELKFGGVQEVCRPILTAGNLEEPALQRGLVSAFLKFKKLESWPLLVAKMIALSVDDDSKDLARFFKKVQDMGFSDVVLNRIKDTTGVVVDTLSQNAMRDVARGVLYNRLTQHLGAASPSDPYSKYKITDSTLISRLSQLVQEADRNATVSDKFDEAMRQASNDIKGHVLVDVYGETTDFSEYNTEMIWAIVQKLEPLIAVSPKHVIQRLDLIGLQPTIEPVVRATLKYLVQTAKIHRYTGKIKGYILNRPEDYLENYTQHWYKIDAAYRKGVSMYRSLDQTEIPQFIELERVHENLNRLYEKHTDQMNREWLKCLNHFNFDYSQLKVAKQYDFYEREIADLDQKVVVIISDALRYEAAQELLSEMHGDPKNTAEMRYMLASIPSTTNVGMSQLLPGSRDFNGGEISIGGLSASGIDNRAKILQSKLGDSTAVQFADLDGMSIPSRREIFKQSVVYIYHDVIDATGDKKVSERRTFAAVTEAVDELKRLVKSLHASMNVAKVIITADHGFLYNDSEIEEKDKEALPTADAIQSHNRYFLSGSKVNHELGYSIPLSATTVFKEDLFVNIPSSVNRYRKQGVGHQFVHGGGSLQELVLPVIESSRKRIDVTKKVKVILVKRGPLRVVSNILKVELLQESEVSRLEKERTVAIGLYLNNELVSNRETIALNFTSDSPSDRMARVELTLSPKASGEPFLKLSMFDVDDLLNPIFEERVENKTLIQTDF